MRSIPLPNDDINIDSPPFFTCDTYKTQIELQKNISYHIKNKIENYKKMFNVIEQYRVINLHKDPTTIIQTTYNKELFITANNFIYKLTTTLSRFFYIFDIIIFAAKAIELLHANNIFPIVFFENSICVFTETGIPIIDNIYNSVYKPITHISVVDNISNIDYSYTMSPDIFVVKYALTNNIMSLNITHIQQIMNIITNKYTDVIPNVIITRILKNINKYINNYYLHMSSSSIVKFNMENIHKHSVFSIAMIYIKLTNEFFYIDSQNKSIVDLLLNSIIKFIDPNQITTPHELFQNIHDIFYIKSMNQSYFFEIIHTCSQIK